MADAVVALLVENLNFLLKPEVALAKNLSDDVRFIIDKFKSMQDVLKNADERSEMEEAVKVWVTQLRDVAFEIEDLLDEYMIQYHKQQSPVQGHGACASIHKIKQLFNKYLVRWRWRNLYRQIHNIKLRMEHIESAESIQHKFAAAVDSMTAGAAALSNPFVGPSRRVKRSCEFAAESTEGSMKTSTSIVHDPRDGALFLDKVKPVGIDEPREQLIRWLLEKPAESRLGVISVLGPRGFGKTTLVKKVYDSEEVKQHFSIRIWFTISRNYDTACLLRELIMAMCKHEDPEWLFSELENMGAMELKQILSVGCLNEKYMMVMDDMQHLGAWNEIKSALPRRGRGSRIIVTTCSEDIATSCQGNYGYVHKLKPLSSEDSRTLFKKIAFKQLNDSSTQHLREVGQKFLEKCGGIPLAIITIAGLLSTETTEYMDSIYGDHDDSLLNRSELNDLDKILSYDDLPDHLKSCLLYLCLFPDNYVIKCSRLLRLWVAEGFLENEIWLHNLSKEDVAKSYLDELIARSLIEEQDMDGSGRVRTCHVHSRVYNYVLRKARDQNLTELFMNWSPDKKPSDRVQRLSIFINEDVEESNLPKGKWFFPKIQSFLAHGESSLFNSSIVTIFLSGRIQLLKVLDLEGIHLDEFPGEALSTLSSLSYLGLNSERLSLPNSIGRLVNLETLVLKGSLFFQLPVEILHLKCLRNLLGDFLELPEGIGHLTTLEKLCTVVGYGRIDEELGKLTQLRSLDILLKKKDKNDHIPNSVQKMEHLRSLRLRMSDPKENTLEVGNLTSLPPVLQRITLIGLMKDTPDWIPKLTKLTKLRLAFSELKDDSFFEGLQKLSDLRELVLEMNAINVAELHFRHEGFSNLRTLKLHGLTELRRIKVEEGAMPLIRHICFCDCQQLENVPVGIEHLTTLKHVDWFGMPTGSEDKVRSFCWKDGHSPIINVNQLFDKFALAD